MTIKWPRMVMVVAAPVVILTVGFIYVDHHFDKQSALYAPRTTVTSTAPWSPFPSGYEIKVEKITRLYLRGATSQPSAADTAELFDEVLHDPDFRIRVRAMAVLPYVGDREKAIDVLITSLRDQDPKTSGNGNVPLYATNYLAHMNATRAIPDIENWIGYMKKNQPYGQRVYAMMMGKSSADLARLKAATTQQSQLRAGAS